MYSEIHQAGLKIQMHMNPFLWNYKKGNVYRYTVIGAYQGIRMGKSLLKRTAQRWFWGVMLSCFDYSWWLHESLPILNHMLLLLSHFSNIWLCATSWMAAHQAPMSTGFSRQEYWSGLPFSSPIKLHRTV